MKLKFTKQRGDTLIEVVFALAILATILTVVTSAAVTAWRTSRVAGERAQATAMATEQVEALRAYRQDFIDDWSSFRDNFPDASLRHMEIDTSEDQWDLKSGDVRGSNIGAVLPDASISLVRIDNIDPLSTSIDIRVEVKWKSLGSSVENTSTQLVTFSENK